MTAKVFDIFDQFATDPKLELEGTWVEVGSALRTLENGESDPASVPSILVARQANKRHNRLVTAQYEANKTVLEGKDDAADDKNEEITINVMSQSILMGWKNFSFKGETLKDGWDIGTAKRLLGVKDFRALVHAKSLEFANYKIKQDSADAKK